MRRGVTVGVTPTVTVVAERNGPKLGWDWSPDAVWEREVEAQDTMLRLPRDRLAGFKAAWPAIVRDFVDAVGAEETRQKDGYPFDPTWARRAPPSARAIDRMHEVWAWHQRYLLSDTIGCQVIQGMALARALDHPLLWRVPKSLRKQRWQAYRIRDRALLALADGLSADHVRYSVLEAG